VTEKSMQTYAFRKTALSLALLLIFSLAAPAFNACFRLNESESYERVELRALNMNSDALMQLDELELLKQEFKGANLSFSTQVSAYLKSGAQTFPISAVLTDSNYSLFSNWTLTKGTFITEDAYSRGRNVAVISEALASKLFMSLNVIGNRIQIFDREYTIVGLYKPLDSLITLLNSDGTEQVYIPITSHQSMNKLLLQTVFIKSSALAKATFKETTLTEVLIKKLKLNMNSYKIVLFDKKPVLLAQFQDILYLCIGLGLSIKIIKLLLYFWRKRIASMKSSLENMYWGEYIKRYYLRCMRSIIITIAGIGTIYFVFRCFPPQIYIPSQYLPQENIFDLKFYIELLKTEIQHHNAMYDYLPTAMESSYSTLFIINLILLCLSLPAQFSLSKGIKLNQYLNNGIRTYLSMGIAALIIAVAGHMLLTLWGFYEWVFPIKGPLLMLTYYIACSISIKQ
jgi:putative ABC transport system permease protein